jgi:hypothetical protein
MNDEINFDPVECLYQWWRGKFEEYGFNIHSTYEEYSRMLSHISMMGGFEHDDPEWQCFNEEAYEKFKKYFG